MRCFNEHYSKCDVRRLGTADEVPLPGPVRPYAQFFSALWFLDYGFAAQPTFRYIERGAMASMGKAGGVMQMSNSDITPGGPNITGFAAWAAWKAVYLTKQLSWSNMMLSARCWPDLSLPASASASARLSSAFLACSRRPQRGACARTWQFPCTGSRRPSSEGTSAASERREVVSESKRSVTFVRDTHADMQLKLARFWQFNQRTVMM